MNFTIFHPNIILLSLFQILFLIFTTLVETVDRLAEMAEKFFSWVGPTQGKGISDFCVEMRVPAKKCVAPLVYVMLGSLWLHSKASRTTSGSTQFFAGTRISTQKSLIPFP